MTQNPRPDNGRAKRKPARNGLHGPGCSVNRKRSPQRGELAEWLRSGLQIRVQEFDSPTRLQTSSLFNTSQRRMTPGGEAFLSEHPLHRPAACDGIFHVHLVYPAHQLQIVIADRSRFVVEAAPADPEELGLPCQAQDVVAVCDCFARGYRPALSSADSKKRSPGSTGRSSHAAG